MIDDPQVKGARVLVVDDDAGLVEFFVEMLAERGLDAHGETDPKRALGRILGADGDYDVVVSDVEMPGLRGPELMHAVHTKKPSQLVVLMTAFGSIDLAVQTVRAGAIDFLAKPFPPDALVLAIGRALRERSMRREIVRLQSMVGGGEVGDLVAQSEAMKRVLDLARRAARSKAAVLLTGESGVGKSSVAAFIHRVSPRASGPFVTLNCAALPVTLAEAELFGAKRGAYTGASEDREGLFTRASQGTLFLDEVGELPMELQPKLLEVLETGKLRPLGGAKELTTDARVVAATNSPLEVAVAERRFRPDLFFRLNVVRIAIPPLRERVEDLPLLVDALIRRAAQRSGRAVGGITQDALRVIARHPWPGNVRELANAVERAVIMSEHDVLVAEDLVFDADTRAEGDFMGEAVEKRLPLEAVERAYIQRVLDAVGGVKLEAARVLGIDRRTLYRKLDATE